jgi:hypothetical protein
VRRETVAGHDAARIENQDGSRLVAAVKGCHLLLVIAVDEEVVQGVAPAVFRS